MSNGSLSALSVKRAHDKGEAVTLSDGAGLYFRKQTSNGASWMLRYRFAGKPRWMTLGNYPDMSLAEARVEARKSRVQLDRKLDPLAERRSKLEKEAGRGTFADLAEQWYQSEIVGHVEYPGVARRYLDKYLLPALRSEKADEVTTPDIMRVVDKIKRKKPTAANDLMRFARRIFDFGVRRRLLTMNPAAGLSPKRDGGGTERPRQRALRRDEISAIFAAAEGSPSFGQVNTLLLKLLLALLVRKGQLLPAKWTEFDLDGTTDLGPVWHLPARRGKSHRIDVDIPLVPRVVEWLRTAKIFAGNNAYVFPRLRQDRRARTPHMALSTLNAALKNLPHGIDHFTVHDLRRTARTHLAALGVRQEVAEKCIGHKFKGVVGTYDAHPYFEERREVLQTWTTILTDAVEGRNMAAATQGPRGQRRA